MGKRKIIRQDEVRKRKNFFPTLLITLFLWLGLTGLIYFVEPDTFGILPVFFVLLFLALLFTFSTIFANRRRGFTIATALTVFLLLRYFGIGNIVNLILLFAIVTTIEIYFFKRR